MSIPPLHVGTDDGLHVLGTRGSTLFEGHEITAISRQGARWWAILDKREIWRSEAGGRWGKQARVASHRALCLEPARSGLLVGTSDAHLLRLRLGVLETVESFDDAPSRESWFTPWGGPPETRSISISPGGEIYVNVHVGGVMCSRDNGASWEPTVDIDTDVHQVCAHPAKPKIVFAASAAGLGTSKDAGKTWTFETRGFHANYQRAVSVSDGAVLVSASRSERGQSSAVYRRAGRDTGGFKKCERGLPEWFPDNINTSCLASCDQYAAIGSPEGTVYASSNRGLSWERIAKDLPKLRCLAFAAPRKAAPKK